METIKAIYQSSSHLKSPNDDGGRWGVHHFYNAEIGFLKAPGVLDASALVPDLELELVGNWESNKYGRQFKVSRYSKCTPKGREGIIAFIRQIPGIGSKIAGDIFERFGEESIDMIINKPDDVASVVRGFNGTMAMEGAEILSDGLAEGKLKMPLVTLFAGIAFPKALPKWIIDSRKADPVELTKRNPFWLMGFKGVGFNRCDELRKKLKLPADMPERYRAAAIQSFQEKSDSVWVHFDKICNDVRNFLEVPKDKAIEILRDLYKEGMIDKEGAHLGLTQHINDEKAVCKLLAKRASFDSIWPDMSLLVGNKKGQISEHQALELARACSNGRLAWLLGSPGTGKTYTAMAVIRAFAGRRILACAPTGKAANRLGQVLAEEDIPVQPTTIHKMLEPRPAAGGWSFNIDGINAVLEADLIVVDEISMLDNWLAYSLLRAIPENTYVLFIGDPNQLPPVGRGAMLRDWKHYCDNHGEGTYGELTEIRRNAGHIVESCAKIRNGVAPSIRYSKEPGLTDDPNLQMAIAMKDEDMSRQLRVFVANLKAGRIRHVQDPLRDVQFLVAVNKDSPVSREVVNEFLQAELNPRASGDHAIFKIGDKVICTSNSKLKEYDPAAGREKEDSGVFMVANGDLGIVIESLKNRVIVRMESHPQRYLIFPTGTGKGDLDLGFAITGHKSQGSEWPVVFTVLGRGYRANRVIGREWFYTCVSRAKKLGIVCGSTEIVRDAVKRMKMWERKSFFDKWMEEFHDEQQNPCAALEDSGGHEGTGTLEVRELDHEAAG